MSKSRRRRGRYEQTPEPGSEAKRSRTRGAGDSSLWSGLRRSSSFRPSRLGPSIKVATIAIGVLTVTGLWLFRDDLVAFLDRPPVTTVSEESVATTVAATITSPTTTPAAVDLQALLEDAGFGDVTITVLDDVLYLDGVIPTNRLESGLFAYVDAVRATVLDAVGSADVRSRLRVRGDAGALAREIERLVGDRPVVFEDGSAELSESSVQTLSDLAIVINAHPGVVVAVAGHTDAGGSATQNQQVSLQRATVVVEELVARGVSVNRLTVLGYGDALPEEGSEPSRRIEFEVVG